MSFWENTNSDTSKLTIEQFTALKLAIAVWEEAVRGARASSA